MRDIERVDGGGGGGAWGEAVNASHRNLAVSCFSLLKSRALLESFFYEQLRLFTTRGDHDENLFFFLLWASSQTRDHSENLVAFPCGNPCRIS